MNRAQATRGNFVNLRRSSLALAIAALSAAPALAVDGVWLQGAAGTYTYSDAANWQGGIVASGADALANFATVDVNGIAVVNLTADPTLGSLRFGDSDISSPGGYQLTGSAMTLAGAAPTITTNALATGSTARIDNILGGTNGLTLTGAGTVHFTAANTYTGGTTLNSASVLLGSSNVFALIGAAGTNLTLNGTNTISSGHSASGTMEIQQNIIANAGSTTTFNLGVRSRVGQTGTARTVTGSGNLVFNMSGNVSRNDFTANFTGFTGNINITAPQVLGTDGVTPVFPVGRMLINGGQFGAGFTAAAVTLSDFATLQPITNSGGNTINFGSLSSTSSTVGFQAPTAGPATLSIGALNTNTTFAGLFLGNNIITKVGTGSLTLTTSQDFHTGNVNVNAGTLALSGAGALPTAPIITLANGATFDVSATNSTYSTGVGAGTGQTVQSPAGSTSTIAGNYRHGQGVLQPGTLTGAGRINFNGGLTLDGGTLNLELSPNVAPGGTNDLLSVSGVTTLGGGLTLNLGLLGGLSTGQYTLIQSAGGFSGSVGGWTINFGGRGAAPTVAVVGSNLVANVSSIAGINLTWTGTTNGNWDVNATSNFKNSTTNAAEKFFQLDSARFDDTSAVNTVALVSSLAPAAVVVDNSAVNYTFNGTGAIIGGGSLTKRGTGSLTIANTGVNSYSGGTTIEAGTVDIGTLGQNGIGTGKITLAGGTLRAITPTGGNITLANEINVTGNATLITANSGTTARQSILGGPITGSGTLTLTNDNLASIKGADIANTSGFTGTLIVNDALTVRLSGAVNGNSDMNLVVNGTGIVGTVNAATLVIPLRTLSGNGRVTGHSSGGGGSTAEYQIGATNASSTFDGVVTDGLQTGTAPIVRPVLITKAGAGTLTLNGTNTYTGTTTVKAGTLALGVNATAPVLGATTATTTGGADIQGGKLVLAYAAGNSPATQVRSILAAGYAEPTKFLTGQIRSSLMPATGRTLGYVDDTANSTVTIAYTIPGDATLNFSVGFDDLVPLAQNYNGQNRVWSQGDFDYNNTVEFNDLVILAQNYNSTLSLSELNSLGSDFAADWALAQSLVPEPTSLAAIAGVATLVLRRRR